ncbi:MAG: hypothetical protein SFV22_20140 [Saprospiraceae bacterium]|nr:hypothetical protein [Saprospiraceae bacterium]
MRYSLFFLFLLSAVFVTAKASAGNSCDTLLLKNGGFLVAEVLEQTQERVRLRECSSIDKGSFWLDRAELKDFPMPAGQEEESNELSLAGPRMGLVFFSGTFAERIQDPSSRGGLGAKPIMSQFGYQFETAYINGDKVQVLFEFVPNISGLDQGKFIPTVSILNGIRLTPSGWEVMLGPIIYFTKRAEGFYDEAGDWTLLSEWKAKNPGLPDPAGVKKGFDTRGDFTITTSFLLAVGKNFRSGNVNFPVNIFAIPNPEGVRFGVSVGFNKQR